MGGDGATAGDAAGRRRPASRTRPTEAHLYFVETWELTADLWVLTKYACPKPG
jgi:hypothetical protein